MARGQLKLKDGNSRGHAEGGQELRGPQADLLGHDRQVDLDRRDTLTEADETACSDRESAAGQMKRSG